MPSVLDVNQIRAEYALSMHDFDPNSASATASAWVSLLGFSHVVAGFFRTIGTGTFAMSIAASASADGSNPTTIKSYSGSNPDAVGDQVFLECSAIEINNLLQGAKYVAAVITFGTSTDEGVVLYARKGLRCENGLTADTIS